LEEREKRYPNLPPRNDSGSHKKVNSLFALSQ
jgi:hypothetical protein